MPLNREIKIEPYLKSLGYICKLNCFKITDSVTLHKNGSYIADFASVILYVFTEDGWRSF